MGLNLRRIDNADIRVDMPVQVVFDAVTDEITLAKFAPLPGWAPGDERATS